MTAPNELSSNELVRQNHGESRDPRVSRTRTKIFDAVDALVSRPNEAISVAAIVREAGISKSSFYSHFASFDELALQVVGRAYVQLGDIHATLHARDNRSRAARVTESYTRLVTHHVENRPLYVAVLALPTSRSVHTRAHRSMAADIEPDIASNIHLPAGLQPHLAASMIAAAVVGFLDEWLESEFEATPDELVRHILALLPPWYTGDS